MSDLPPLEEPQAYVVVGPEDQRGPYTLELLIGEVLAGRLSDATPVWWPGLVDWTTMGGHAGLSGEIQRRRSATLGSAPGWSDPAATYSAPQPTYEQQQPSYEQQPYQQPYEPQPAAYEQQPYEQPQPSYEQPGTFGTSYDPQRTVYEQAAGSVQPTDFPAPSQPVDEGSGSGTLIDVDSTGAVSWVSDAGGTSTQYDPQQDVFDDLVSRSSRRAESAGRISAAEEELLAGFVEGAAGQGFTHSGRDVVDGAHELRFDGDGGTQLVLTVGRLADLDTEKVASAVVPFSASLHSSSHRGAVDARSGRHGEVLVVSDEWSGQTTSSVSLLLGLEDYLGADLAVDRPAASRDAGATVAAVRRRLG